MVARTPDRALTKASIEIVSPARDWEGWCLQFVRTMYGVPARYPSAKAAWEAVPAGARGRGAAPPGAIFFWAVGQHGHCGIALGNEFVVSTDLVRKGKPDAHPIALAQKRWGARALGWTWRLNGVDLQV